MIGIYGNKQTMPESQKRTFLRRYYLYGKWRICLCLPCFTQAGKSDLPTLYNKALCYYYLSLYNDCRSLLLEAERLLPPLTERLPENLPEAFRPPLGIRKKPCRLSHAGGCSLITSPPYNC